MTTLFNSENHDDKRKDEGLTGEVAKKVSYSNKPPQVTHDAKLADKHTLFGHSHNPITAFCYYPDKVRFVTEDPEEKVVLLLRKHPITNIGWISLAFLMIIAPAFVSVFPFFENLPPNYQLIIVIIWYLVTFAFALEGFLSWFFHVNIVTDERIVEVDFINLIYREVTDANIDQIQDVTVEVGGSLRTFLHYGDVVIQTAAQVPKIEFEDIPQPDQVAKILRELRVEEQIEKLEGRVR